MIFYFSGTGNSRYVAEYIAKETGDLTVNICNANLEKIDISEDIKNCRSIGFVFPVYSWGVPPIVSDFVRTLPEHIITSILGNNIDIWMTATCGDETGNAHKMFKSVLKKRNLILKGVWSVIMPNTYVLLPGFDIDSETVRKEKINNAPTAIIKIANKIRCKDWDEDVTIGSYPVVKTKLIYPLFKRWGISPRKWKANNCCIGCASCSKACPVNNIKMSDSKPQWGTVCTSCMACYHVCPEHAVEYGHVTRNKGQYPPDKHPKI